MCSRVESGGMVKVKRGAWEGGGGGGWGNVWSEDGWKRGQWEIS